MRVFVCACVCARVLVHACDDDADGNHAVACLPRGATDDTRAGSADGVTDGVTDVGADSAAASRSVGRVGLGLPHERFTRHGSVGSVDRVAQLNPRQYVGLTTHVLSQRGA